MHSYQFTNNFNKQKKNNKITYYYQLASFLNPKTNLYELRRFTINSKNEFLEIKNYLLNKKQFDDFLINKKQNEYKIFSVYDLSIIDYPILSDILISKSDILNTSYNYSGYAPF